jgi:Sulfotransferase family
MTSPMSPSIDAASATGPVFLVGMNGSGTTMLLHSLGNHPDLYGCKRETRVLPHFIAHLHRYGTLGDDDNFLRLMRDIYALRAFRQLNGGHPVPLPEDWATMPRDLASIVDTAFRYFAVKEHKKRWADKTPMHALHITALARLFPSARFVHVIRDGRDSAASFHRRWHRTPEVTIHRWKTVVREARRQGMGVGDRYFELRYEDLTREPEVWMARVCTFLGLPFCPAVLQSRQPWMAAAKKPQAPGIVRNSGNWRTYFEPGTIADLESIAGSTLAACGYETARPASDRDPPKVVRLGWMIRDYLAQGTHDLRAMVKRRDFGGIAEFRQRARDAFRQLWTMKY